MEKYLVQIEFIYYSVPKSEDDTVSNLKTVTIGIYDTFEEACKNGNNLLEKLESKFELQQSPDGTKAKKERFSENGDCFGNKTKLVSELAYLKTPFYFIAMIETLRYDPIDDVIDDITMQQKKYDEYKLSK